MMEVPDGGDWEGHFAKYVYMVALLVGVGWCDVGPVYLLWCILVSYGLGSRKGSLMLGNDGDRGAARSH